MCQTNSNERTQSRNPSPHSLPPLQQHPKWSGFYE